MASTRSSQDPWVEDQNSRNELEETTEKPSEDQKEKNQTDEKSI